MWCFWYDTIKCLIPSNAWTRVPSLKECDFRAIQLTLNLSFVPSRGQSTEHIKYRFSLKNWNMGYEILAFLFWSWIIQIFLFTWQITVSNIHYQYLFLLELFLNCATEYVALFLLSPWDSAKKTVLIFVMSCLFIYCSSLIKVYSRQGQHICSPYHFCR